MFTVDQLPAPSQELARLALSIGIRRFVMPATNNAKPGHSTCIMPDLGDRLGGIITKKDGEFASPRHPLKSLPSQSAPPSTAGLQPPSLDL